MKQPSNRWQELAALTLNAALLTATAAVGAVAGWLSVLLGAT